MNNLAFYLGFGMLATHELDAVANHEWRVLPLLHLLPDETGELIFVLAHVPLFAGLLALVASENTKIRFRSRVAVSVFLVVHALLHLLFRDHPAYEFSALVSNLLIVGGAGFGAVFLMLEWLQVKRPAY